MQLRFVTIRPLSETLQIQSASTLWWCWGDGARAVSIAGGFRHAAYSPNSPFPGRVRARQVLH